MSPVPQPSARQQVINIMIGTQPINHPGGKQRSQHNKLKCCSCPRFRFSFLHSLPVSKRRKKPLNPAAWSCWNSNKKFISHECLRSCPQRLLSELFVHLQRHPSPHFAGHMHFWTMVPNGSTVLWSTKDHWSFNTFLWFTPFFDHQPFIPRSTNHHQS